MRRRSLRISSWAGDMQHHRQLEVLRQPQLGLEVRSCRACCHPARKAVEADLAHRHRAATGEPLAQDIQVGSRPAPRTSGGCRRRGGVRVAADRAATASKFEAPPPAPESLPHHRPPPSSTARGRRRTRRHPRWQWVSISTGGPSSYLPVHTGLRLAMKASMPSAASSHIMLQAITSAPAGRRHRGPSRAGCRTSACPSRWPPATCADRRGEPWPPRRRGPPSGTTGFTSPRRCASAASMKSPVTSISKASLRPMLRDRPTLGVAQKRPTLMPDTAKRAIRRPPPDRTSTPAGSPPRWRCRGCGPPPAGACRRSASSPCRTGGTGPA